MSMHRVSCLRCYVDFHFNALALMFAFPQPLAFSATESASL